MYGNTAVKQRAHVCRTALHAGQKVAPVCLAEIPREQQLRSQACGHRKVDLGLGSLCRVGWGTGRVRYVFSHRRGPQPPPCMLNFCIRIAAMQPFRAWLYCQQHLLGKSQRQAQFPR